MVDVREWCLANLNFRQSLVVSLTQHARFLDVEKRGGSTASRGGGRSTQYGSNFTDGKKDVFSLFHNDVKQCLTSALFEKHAFRCDDTDGDDMVLGIRVTVLADHLN